MKPRDVFGYGQLPGWDELLQTDAKPAQWSVVGSKPTWLKVVTGVGTGCAALFFCQLLLAFASGDLKGYRARALDTATFVSLFVAVPAGVVTGKVMR